MAFYKTIYEIYTAEQKVFADLVDELLEKALASNDIVTRLVFFGNPADNNQYLERLGIIREKTEKKFGQKMPALSYVAQRPLVGKLVLEVYKLEKSFEGEIVYKSHEDINYLEIFYGDHSELVIGGLQGNDINARIKNQSDEIFIKLGDILTKENYEISSIVRQWNYIERITEFNGEHQHYQDFNDSRSHFYAKTTWSKGYPAATGIGVEHGGVLVDANVVKPKNGKFDYVPLDNALQVAAHAYSQNVLLGMEDETFKSKTTPKFERAKAICGDKGGLVYVSGTAAIRGEESLTDVGILVQTGTTMENINYLISKENLNKVSVLPDNECELQMLRVYLKYPEDITAVKVYMEHLFTSVPISYLLADVCRDELLIEIEGVASFRISD